MADREYRLTVRMSEAEGQMLKEIAEQAGLTASDIVRVFVRQRHAELFADRKPAKQKKK
jgi:antitoxin component of RelBE/YafQ-DinJ toxin-antitoxin module